MKPDGRALDIVVIGLGQAGGNLAAEFFRRGYRALAFNTAQTDLSALEPGGVFPTLPAERRIYIGLDGYDGAGADPSYGRDCVREHTDRIKSAVLKQASDADAVIVAAGLGGGTGSAVPELIELLKDEQLPILTLLTLPTGGESGIAKVNAVRAINELVDAPLLGWVFVDNARIASLNPDVSVVDYFAHINSQIAAPIDELNRLNARDELKAIRSFDGEDFRKLLLSGGVLNYAVVELPGVTTEEVVGTIHDAMDASDLMPGGFDISRLSYVGLVIEAPEKILADTPIATFEEIAAQLKKDTQGAAIYYGIYRSKEGSTTTLRLIAATQTLPTRIRQVLADAKREGGLLGDKIREELPTLELGELEAVELFRTRTRPSERPRKNKMPSRPLDLLEDVALELGGGKKLEVKDPRAQTPDRSGRPRPKPRASESEVKPEPKPEAKTELPKPRMDEARKQASEDPRRPVPPPRPPPPPSAPRDLGTEEIDVVAELAALRGPQEDEDDVVETIAGVQRGKPSSAELPSPEVYDRLVSDYLQAKAAKARQEVVQRLERDSTSSDAVVRYYAVEAMAKLGRKVFGSALLAATEDEDDAVRQLAVEALKA